MASPIRPLRRVGSFLIFASLVTSLLASAPSAPVQAEPLPPLGVVIRGHGNGHGRGLSQYGALGWATKLGTSWQDILNFYYGGSGRVLAPLTEADASATPGGVMSVRLQTLDARPTAVISDNITASWVGAAGTYGGLVARMVSNNVYDIYGATTATCAAGVAATVITLAATAATSICCTIYSCQWTTVTTITTTTITTSSYASCGISNTTAASTCVVCRTT